MNAFNLPKATELQALDQQIATDAVMKKHEDMLTAEADQIYTSGLFPEYVAGAFSKIWCGDDHLIRWIMIQFANGFISNSDEGIHLYISGPSGLGKSEGIKQSLTLIPARYVISGTFSRKAVLYLAKTILPGSIIFHDDHIVDEVEAELFRAILAGWKDESNYFTVDKQASVKIIVPRRISRIITSVETLAQEFSDGQNESRFLTLEIRRTIDDLHQIVEFINSPNTSISHEREVIMAIWERITSNPVAVEIPYLSQIKCSDQAVMKLREYKRFLSAIRAIALLRGRTTATHDDFTEAAQMFSYLTLMQDNEIPGLSRRERVVFEKINDLLKSGRVTAVSDICKDLPLSQITVYQAIRGGHGGTFESPTGGLLTKIKELRAERVYEQDTGKHQTYLSLTTNPNTLGLLHYTLCDSAFSDGTITVLPLSQNNKHTGREST